MWERFTERARKALVLANQEAQRNNHEYIDTQHVLVAIVKEGSGVGATMLRNLGVDLGKVRAKLENESEGEPYDVPPGRLPPSPRAKQVIQYAVEEARNLNHNYVGTEHLVLGLLRQHDGIAARVLESLGVRLENAMNELRSVLQAAEQSELGTARPSRRPTG